MLLQALQAEPRFDAPKAQLWRLVIRGLLSDERGWDPVKVALASWLVVPALWIASSRSRDVEPNRTGAGP
jgi:hypothetical protein